MSLSEVAGTQPQQAATPRRPSKVTEGPALPTVASNQPRCSHTQATQQGKGGPGAKRRVFASLPGVSVLEAEGVKYDVLILRNTAPEMTS